MRRRLCPTRVNQVLEAHNIALNVGTWDSPVNTEPRLRREMDNAVKIVLGKQRVDYLSVGQITSYKGKPE
ncbi:MAG: hypothetical protein CM15mP74_36780 [Halieaceae bacterium]|nr:MAG: hypothetical protein CM15mP74_36780 [Halieaceae bacterium]